MIYFDNNATTRISDEVVDAMRPYLVGKYANPSSAIGSFEGIAQAISLAKTSIANHLGHDDGRSLIATSGATEANNLAILGAARANPRRRHLVTSAIEHPSVLEVMRYLESTGYRLSILPVSSRGCVDPDDIRRTVDSETLLVSLMFANNESGVIQPIESVGAWLKESNSEVLFHVDATQAVGRVNVDLDDSLASIDLLSFSAHKFHGPKGVGALFLRDSSRIAPLMFGGGQQNGLRSGTENAAGIVGMAAAIGRSPSLDQRIRELRDLVERELVTRVPGAAVLGFESPRLANTTFIHLPGIVANELVDWMATRSVAISAGSACMHGAQNPSYVALAMGLNHEQAQCCIRISLSAESRVEEIEAFLRNIQSFQRTKGLLVLQEAE